MDQKTLNEFKETMLDRLEHLLRKADDTVVGMHEQTENYPDPTDRASEEENRNFLLRIRDREHKLIKKVKKALVRIENGTFGVCDKCGEDITIERLHARPVTTQCIDCKKQGEAKERALGI